MGVWAAEKNDVSAGKLQHGYLEVVLLIVSLEMTPPEAELRVFDPTAFLVVDLCLVSISPPFSERCNCSGKSSDKPVRSAGTFSQSDNLFGPEPSSTLGDIVERDVFNVTWTGSSILSRGCSTVSLQPLKRNRTVSV